MANADQIKTTIKVDSKDTKKIKQAGKEYQDLNGIAKGVTSTMLKSVGAYAAAGLSINALVGQVNKSIEAYKKQEQAEAKRNAILKATQGAVGRTTEELNAYASALQKVTTYGDDAIIDLQAVLMTFKSIQGDVFDRTTEVALDLSAAFGQDLKSSAIQLGKALEDPKTGLTALKRIGVSFSESEKEMITQLTEQNRVSEAQAQILGVLERQVGGTARAMASTATGELEQFKNAFSDLNEEMGKTVLLMSKDLISSMTEVVQAMEGTASVGNTIKETSEKMKEGNATLEDQVKFYEAQMYFWEEYFRKSGTTADDLNKSLRKQYDSQKLLLDSAKERLRLAEQLTLEQELQARADALQQDKKDKAAAEAQTHMDALNAAYDKTKEAQTELLRQQIAYFEGFIQGPKAVAVLKMLREELDRINGKDKEKKKDNIIPFSAYDHAIEDQKQKVSELNDTWNVYWQVRKEIADLEGQYSENPYDQQRLELLHDVSSELEDQLGIEKKIKEETDEANAAILEFSEAFQEEFTNLNNIAAGLSSSIVSIGQGLAEGQSVGDAFGNALRKQFSAIAAQISTLAIAAGLKEIFKGNPAGWSLLALGGVGGLFAGFMGGGSSSSIINYDKESQAIIDAERDLAEARIELIKDQLEEERELRNDHIKKLQDEFNLEFAVLRDLWQRNIISTAQFEQEATGINEGYREDEAAANDAYAVAEALANAKEEKVNELNALIDEITREQEWYRKFMPGASENLAGESFQGRISALEKRIENAMAAGTIDEVLAAKHGADFITNGPQLLLVGDNASGRERVRVEPMPAAGGGGGFSSGVTININAPVYGVDDLYKKLNQAGQKLYKRGQIA